MSTSFIFYSFLLTGEVNTGQFHYSDWLLSGRYDTVKTASWKNGIFRTTNIIKTKKLSPVNKYKNNLSLRIDLASSVYTSSAVNVFRIDLQTSYYCINIYLNCQNNRY